MIGRGHIKIDARDVSEVAGCSHAPEKGNGGHNRSQPWGHRDYDQELDKYFRPVRCERPCSGSPNRVITPDGFSSGSMPSTTSAGANSGEWTLSATATGLAEGTPVTFSLKTLT